MKAQHTISFDARSHAKAVHLQQFGALERLFQDPFRVTVLALQLQHFCFFAKPLSLHVAAVLAIARNLKLCSQKHYCHGGPNEQKACGSWWIYVTVETPKLSTMILQVL